MSDAQLLGAGYTWQELSVGQRFRKFRRTITETDIINFISVTGCSRPSLLIEHLNMAP